MQAFASKALAVAAVAASILLGGALMPVAAQQIDPGQANGGRDCQTIRTCNFSRTGAVRGCLSSYSCRTCRLVVTRCEIGAVSGPCRRLRCDWGG